MKGISMFLCVCETRAFPPSCTWPSYAIFLELQTWNLGGQSPLLCPEPDGFPAWEAPSGLRAGGGAGLDLGWNPVSLLLIRCMKQENCTNSLKTGVIKRFLVRISFNDRKKRN